MTYKTWIQSLKVKAKALKQEIVAIYLAYQKKETPLIAKIMAFLVVAYAVSPIDLIPDFVPVLGYLDDLLILPMGIRLVLKLIPKEVMDQCRMEAKKGLKEGIKTGILAAIIISALWMLVFLCIVEAIL